MSKWGIHKRRFNEKESFYQSSCSFIYNIWLSDMWQCHRTLDLFQVLISQQLQVPILMKLILEDRSAWNTNTETQQSLEQQSRRMRKVWGKSNWFQINTYLIIKLTFTSFLYMTQYQYTLLTAPFDLKVILHSKARNELCLFIQFTSSCFSFPYLQWRVIKSFKFCQDLIYGFYPSLPRLNSWSSRDDLCLHPIGHLENFLLGSLHHPIQGEYQEFQLADQSNHLWSLKAN